MLSFLIVALSAHSLTQSLASDVDQTSCHEKIRAQLLDSCDKLTTQSRKKFALDFTNCFYDDMGLPTINCDQMNLEGCFYSMSENQKRTFQNYYAEIDDHCLLGGPIDSGIEVVKEAADKTLKSAKDALEQTGQLYEQQEKIHLAVNDTMEAIKKSSEQTNNLTAIVNEIRGILFLEVDKIAAVAEDQKNRFMNFLSLYLPQGPIRLLRNYLDVPTLFYYFIFVFIVIVVTIPDRVKRIRWTIVFLLVIGFSVERFWMMLLEWMLSDNLYYYVTAINVYCRWFFIIYVIVWYITAFLFYSDPQAMIMNELWRLRQDIGNQGVEGRRSQPVIFTSRNFNAHPHAE